MKRCNRHDNKKNMNKVKCFNCQKFDHFINDFNEPKKIHEMENVCTFRKLN